MRNRPAAVRELTSPELWDRIWEGRTVQRLSRRNFYHNLYAELFKRYVSPGSRVLEAGCGGSIWLPYLAGTIGAEVWGIDYSEVGVRMANENLRAAGAKGTIIYDDLLRTTKLPAGSFDFVFSFGLVEHFDDPTHVIRRLAAFLVSGGLMLTMVPNLQGAVGWLHRLTDRTILQTHREITPSGLDTMHTAAGLVPLQSAGYFGVFSIAVANFSAWRRHLPRAIDRLTWFGVRVTQQVVLVPLRLFRWYPETRVLSPWVQGIYRRG